MLEHEVRRGLASGTQQEAVEKAEKASPENGNAVANPNAKSELRDFPAKLSHNFLIYFIFYIYFWGVFKDGLKFR